MKSESPAFNDRALHQGLIARNACVFRRTACVEDVHSVRDIVLSSGFFSADEVDVAIELVEDCINKGSASPYRFVFADVDGETAGYACYGPIECTVGSFDLYWIAVHDHYRRSGIGRQLMGQTERLIAQQGGERIYVETSARLQYEPTRRFYLACGYSVAAVLDDFYAPRDGKIIFAKHL